MVLPTIDGYELADIKLQYKPSNPTKIKLNAKRRTCDASTQTDPMVVRI